MSLNWLLIWTVATGCGMTLSNLLRFRIYQLARILPSLITLGTLLFAYNTNRDSAGFYAGGVWFLLVLLPGLATQIAKSRLSSHRYFSAWVFACLARIFHPFNESRDQPDLIKALWLLHSREDQSALRLLESISHHHTATAKSAFVILTRLTNRWDNFLKQIHRAKFPQKLLTDPLLSNIYLQALGETGNTELLVKNFQKQMSRQRRGNSALILNISRMKLAAFCGRLDIVAHLVDGPLGFFDKDTKQFWLATAMQASGRIEDANESFQKLLSSKDRQIAIAAEQRVAHPVRFIQQAPPESNEIMNMIESDLEHESQFALISSPSSRRHFATWGLVATLVGFFIYEMVSGGVGKVVMESTSLSVIEKVVLLFRNTVNETNLIRIGALVLPTDMYPGLTRRVFFSAFLHFGVLHLMMNVGGLIILGQRLEDAWGPVWMGLAYLLCAICSIFLLTVLPLGATETSPIVLVGASGGVMGLLGCLFGYLGWGQMQKRNHLVAGEFKLLLFIVAFQMVFDQMTPNVSSECHIMGLLIGTACGLLTGVVKSRRLTNKKTPPVLVREKETSQPIVK